MNIKSSMIPALPGIFGSIYRAGRYILQLCGGIGGVGSGLSIERTQPEKRNFSLHIVFDLTDFKK